MRATEFITEYRDRLLQYVKSLLPTWPEYVLKDWLVPNKGDFSNLPDTELKNGIMEKLQGAGLTPNSKWQLVPDMKFTMDMFDPITKQRLIGRAGGKSDLGMQIPRDAERHATQAALAQQQGGVRKEPVLLIKTANGYELLEGWHRTIQHFAQYPEGYTGPAWVAVAQGQQGVAEAVAPSQYAKLYHSTPAIHLDGILQSGYLAPTGNPAYLSLTRDSKLDYGSWGGEFVEFDIDQNAVRQRIKLEPYNHSATMGGPRATGGGESEERTTQKIPLKGFVTAMHAPTGWEGDKAGEYYGGLLKKYGVPIIYDIVPKLEEQGVAEGSEQKMSVQDTLAYLKKVMGTESHEDWRNHIINTNEYFVLKDISVNSLKSDLSGLNKTNVEKYKQMDFSKAPPIVIGSDGNILDGYHRANVAKALKVPTLKAWVGVKKQGVTENFADGKNPVKFTVTTPDGYTHSFRITLAVHGKHVGHFNFVRGADTDDVNNEVEVESRWQGQGYGKLLLMKAIDVANNHGLDFQQDIRGITDAQQNVYDSLENAGSIVTPGDGFWFLTPQGEQELNGLNENFADGRNPQDKGDSKRHGVPTKASVSTLRKVAKQGGRKGQLSHWLANMKAGKAKAKRK